VLRRTAIALAEALGQQVKRVKREADDKQRKRKAGKRRPGKAPSGKRRAAEPAPTVAPGSDGAAAATPAPVASTPAPVAPAPAPAAPPAQTAPEATASPTPTPTPDPSGALLDYLFGDGPR
jgi:hypothetical protein